MIYVDTSVLLAGVLAEDRKPPVEFWEGELFASRLLEYEVWNRLHVKRLMKSHGSRAREILQGILLIDLSTEVLARALRPFPTVVRTLDALHLATFDFARTQGHPISLASYDERLVHCARRMKFKIERM